VIQLKIVKKKGLPSDQKRTTPVNYTSMKTKLFTSGTYTKNLNSYFSDNGLRYLIATRKNTSPSKPKNYLLAKVDSRGYYISSLYPTQTENLYKAEYQGQRFEVFFDDHCMTVKQAGQ
jgi:hypothetical protein